MSPEEILQRMGDLESTLKTVALKRIRLEGALDEVKKGMKKLGFPTIKKLEAERNRLIGEKGKKTYSLQILLKNFEDKYLDLLEELT
jgi:predicted RNA-binding protein Jag